MRGPRSGKGDAIGGALGLTWRESDQFDEQGLCVRRRRLLVDHLVAEQVEHPDGVDVGFHIGRVYRTLREKNVV